MGVLNGTSGTLLWEMSKSRAVFDIDVFNDWVYTLALLRTSAYSAGAYCCFRLGYAFRKNSL